MIKKYFSQKIKSPYGWGDTNKTVSRYIVTEEEWQKIKRLCNKILDTDNECKFANSILTYYKPYVKKHESEPDMPENSYSFILYPNEDESFEQFCMELSLTLI